MKGKDKKPKPIEIPILIIPTISEIPLKDKNAKGRGIFTIELSKEELELIFEMRERRKIMQ
jgi:hypothetical protein